MNKNLILSALTLGLGLTSCQKDYYLEDLQASEIQVQQLTAQNAELNKLLEGLNADLVNANAEIQRLLNLISNQENVIGQLELDVRNYLSALEFLQQNKVELEEKIIELEALIADLQQQLAQERDNVQQLTMLNEEQIIENQILVELINKLETEATENGETITVQHTQIVEQVKVIENLTTEIEELVVIINEQGDNIIEMQEIIVELETLIETMIEANHVEVLEDHMTFDFRAHDAFMFAGRVFTFDPTDPNNFVGGDFERKVFISESLGRIFVVQHFDGTLLNATSAQTQQDQFGRFSILEVSGIDQAFIASVFETTIEVEVEEFDWDSVVVANGVDIVTPDFGTFTLTRDVITYGPNVYAYYENTNGDKLNYTGRADGSRKVFRFIASGTAANDAVVLFQKQ